MSRKSSKEAILDATERVIARLGLAAATMNAVALEARISKGGLFYHFAGKRDLLFNLIERNMRRFRCLRDDITSTLPDTPLRLLKATILASVRRPGARETPFSNLMALLDDADLREKIQAERRIIFEEVTRDCSWPEKVAVILLAADGLYVAELCGLQTASVEMKQKIITALLGLTELIEKEESTHIHNRATG